MVQTTLSYRFYIAINRKRKYNKDSDNNRSKTGTKYGCVLHACNSGRECSIPTNFYFLIEQFLVNTFAAGLIQAVRTKTACSHVALNGRNSGAKSRRELFKHSKYSEVLQFWFRIFCAGFGFGFFVSHKWNTFRPTWPAISGFRPKPLVVVFH